VLLVVAAWGGLLFARRRRAADSRAFLRALVLVAPLGLIALEAGWVVTEVGRQPFIIQGVMRVRDAVTPMPGLEVSLAVTTLIYLALGVIVLVMLRRHVLSAPR
jgi:cytochrome d ubiquinol oxidase subunit I